MMLLCVFPNDLITSLRTLSSKLLFLRCRASMATLSRYCDAQSCNSAWALPSCSTRAGLCASLDESWCAGLWCPGFLVCLLPEALRVWRQ